MSGQFHLSLGARRLEWGRAATRVLERRICDFSGCETTLSSYNAEPTCWMHTASEPHPVGGRRRHLA